MSNLMYKKYYTHFLNANMDVQHYASHSHHYWPDVTRKAQLDYWYDSSRLVDDKWEFFFTKKIPAAQKLIAKHLQLANPEQIVFAPNTHEFVFRILSCFELDRPVKILTTDSEFHSFERQTQRLAENPKFHITKIKVDQDFEENFINAIQAENYDLIFFSHVFFNSGFVVKDLAQIVHSVKDSETIIVIDGYHSFMAIPTDLSSIQSRVFYIAGSYKYAQGGEGCCFMSVPKGCQLRPKYTGWFAGFGDLTIKSSQIAYSEDGYRFAGSTMDFTALYRLLAVLELFATDGLTVPVIHNHIKKLQANFLNHVMTLNHPLLNEKNLLVRDLNLHGHFFAFELGDVETTKSFHHILENYKIKTDYRGSRLRFGFGLYQDDCIRLDHVRF